MNIGSALYDIQCESSETLGQKEKAIYVSSDKIKMHTFFLSRTKTSASQLTVLTLLLRSAPT